jgi:hypothetical protein
MWEIDEMNPLGDALGQQRAKEGGIGEALERLGVGDIWEKGSDIDKNLRVGIRKLVERQT